MSQKEEKIKSRRRRKIKRGREERKTIKKGEGDTEEGKE